MSGLAFECTCSDELLRVGTFTFYVEIRYIGRISCRDVWVGEGFTKGGEWAGR